jgi:transcription initiation factor TFIIH subunit 2
LSSKSKPTLIPVLDDKLLVSSRDNPNPENDTCCFSCLKPLRGGGTSSSSLKFQCPVCQNCVCVNCDTYLHESLHNCPGCLSQPMVPH